MIAGPIIQCPKCESALPREFFNAAAPIACPNCRAETIVRVYPAFDRPPELANAGELVLVDGEAGCFYHPQKKAVIPCAGCGRFLCALCDVEFRGEHLCPSCIQSGQKKKVAHLENQRKVYDDLALALSLAPFTIIGLYSMFMTAPAALYLSIRHWNAPGSVVRQGKGKFIVAILFSVLEIIGMIVGGIALYVAIRRNGL